MAARLGHMMGTKTARDGQRQFVERSLLMTAINRLMSRVLRTALPASAATTAAVAICGHADDGNAVAPLNAVSHIPWGDVAADQEDASIKYTATGIAINAIAVASWSLIYELAFGRTARKGKIATAILGGASVAALAYATDYYVVPKRLTPGLKSGCLPLRCWLSTQAWP
jgi:hypothetical protein